MTIKAVITQRRRSRTTRGAAVEAVADESTSAIAMGLSVEEQTAQGTLVSGDEDQLRSLEEQGYRVKILPDTNLLHVGAYTIDVDAGLPEVPNNLEVPANLRSRWTHHLVQLIGPPSPEWIQNIEERNVDVVEPISSYGLFVVGSRDSVDGLLELPFVAWVGLFKPAYRISPTLLDMKGTIRYVNVGVYPGSDVDMVVSDIEAIGARVVDRWDREGSYREHYRVLVVESQARKLARIARLPAVRWLEYYAPALETDDERSAQIVAGSLNGDDPPDTAPVTGFQATLDTVGLNGEGVVIGICDTGVDTHDDSTMHPDLRGRLTFFVDRTGGQNLVDGWPHFFTHRRGGHGTHVAGVAVGNGSTNAVDPGGFQLGQGVAPQADFGSINAIAEGGSGTGPLATLTRLMVENGADVMNNSWWQPGPIPDGYNGSAALLDKLVRDPNIDSDDTEYLVLVFSAGNRGPDPRTITPPKEAKNIITVGNSMNFRPNESLHSSSTSDDIRGVNQSSSRGPAVDGRILPTVVAPGTDIISARSSIDTNPNKPGTQPPRPRYTDPDGVDHDEHTPMTGTSMAAPHVAGLCALIIQWWRDRNNGANPSTAMLKALLVNGADDLAGGPDGNHGTLAPIPNNDQGWGRVNLANMILDAPDSTRGPKILVDGEALTETEGEFVLTVTPVDSERPMRITLVWTDVPGAGLNDNPSLVNDLDLEVFEANSNTVFKGNVFEEGFSVTGGSFDDRNNVECVYIRNPDGEYDVAVIAAQLKANARRPFDLQLWQDFALVIDNAEQV